MACHIISKRPPLEMFWLVCLYYFIVNVHGNTSENALENVLLIQFILFPRDTVGNVLFVETETFMYILYLPLNCLNKQITTGSKNNTF